MSCLHTEVLKLYQVIETVSLFSAEKADQNKVAHIPAWHLSQNSIQWSQAGHWLGGVSYCPVQKWHLLNWHLFVFWYHSWELCRPWGSLNIDEKEQCVQLFPHICKYCRTYKRGVICHSDSCTSNFGDFSNWASVVMMQNLGPLYKTRSCLHCIISNWHVCG